MGTSGRVFYSGRSAFERPSDLYILGLNPGGDPEQMKDDMIAGDIDRWLGHPSDDWSAYRDECWEGRDPGKHGMQPRVLDLLKKLHRSPSAVPASNVVFVRSRRERDLEARKGLLELCWPVHQAVIDRLGVKTVACFGQTAGRWVRGKLGAHADAGCFVEDNKRKWVSTAHRNETGLAVLTLTHPSIAAWANANSDPSSLVESMLAAACR
jgi:hypothetical protein